MSATTPRPLGRLGARFATYGNRVYAFLLVLAVIQIGLLAVSEWLVISQVAPGPIRAVALFLLAVMGVFVVVSPGSAAALAFVVGCGVGYLVLSGLEASVGIDGRAPHPLQVLGLAAALYLVHAVDALREALPAGATIEPAVLLRWVRRLAEALVPGLAIGALLMALPTASTGGPFWLLGAVGLLVAVAVPAFALRPRPWVERDQTDC